MKRKIILFFSSFFCISQSSDHKTVITPDAWHPLDHIGKVMHKKFSDNESSHFVVFPELFLLAPDKKKFIDSVQKKHTQSVSTNRKSVSQKKNSLLEEKK